MLRLFRVERLEDLIDLLRLIIEQVASRITDTMPVNQRTAERSTLDRIAVSSQRQMPTSQFELKLTRPRLTKQSEGVPADAATIRRHLLLQPFVAIFARDAFQNLVDQIALIIGEEVTADPCFGDVPVGVDAGLQRMVERQANGQRLLV